MDNDADMVVVVEQNKMDQKDIAVVNKMGELVAEIEVADNWEEKYEVDVQNFVYDCYLIYYEENLKKENDFGLRNSKRTAASAMINVVPLYDGK